MPDAAQSVLDRLRNKARASGKTTQLMLQLFCQEEFLRRLQLSQYHDNLILKGGLLLYSLSKFSGRPTMDVDLLAKSIRSELSTLERVVREIAQTSTGNDYITFEITATEPITELGAYGGVRIKLVGRIKNTKTAFHIDIGIGDVIVPKPIVRPIPTQLDGFVEPAVLSYSLESTVAEKLDAIISRMELTSRMKDFYDLHYLAQTVSFDARTLQEAIYQTLQRRGTPIERDTLIRVRHLADSPSFQSKWERFERDRLTHPLGLGEVMNSVCALIGPIFEAIVDEREAFGMWDQTLQRYTTAGDASGSGKVPD